MLTFSHFLRLTQMKMQNQSCEFVQKIIPPVYVLLVYLSFSVKSVTRRRHIVSEFQCFPGEDAPGPPTGGLALAVLMALSRMLLTKQSAHL